MQKPSEMSWEVPNVGGTVPNRRSGHTFTLCGDKVYLFGGCDHSLPPGPTKDLFALDIAGSNFVWTTLKPTGEAPLPRWRHCGTAVDRRIIVYFGGFRNSNTRFNDVWLYDTTLNSWSQPAPGQTEVVSGVVQFKREWPGVPTPRGAHSMNLLGRKLYVFGGYGGSGFGRRDFNELYSLSVDNWTWRLEVADGEAPEPRSGHNTVVVRDQLYVSGGWNSVRQFDDLFIFNTTTNRWSNADSRWGIPRWNHSGVSVVAVPHWQVFVFGGNSGDLAESGQAQGTFLNDIKVLDTGSNIWRDYTVRNSGPSPRADTEIVFDVNNMRIIMFGGWANRWFGDLYTLRVGEVVGPPYSLSDVHPLIGPITGNSHITIRGVGFSSTSGNPTVRFACPKGYLESTGSVLSDSEIEVNTPAFVKFGPLPVEVRVSIGNQSLTNSSVRFTYFSVTNASCCLAFGPGLLPGNAVGPTMFIIQAIDSDNHLRDTGMDQWTVIVEGDLIPVPETKGEMAPERIPVVITDLNDGTYEVSYVIPHIGNYSVSVSFDGTFEGVPGPIRGSPFQVTAVGNAEKGSNGLEGPVVMGYIRDQARDIKEYSNNTLRGLRKKLPREDVAPLIKTREFLWSVDSRKEEINLILSQQRAALNYMKKRGGHVDRLLDALETAVGLWSELGKQVPQTASAIVPLVKLHGAKTEEKIVEFEVEIRRKAEQMNKEPFWAYSTGSRQARQLMDAENVKVMELRALCEENTHLCKMFDFPALMKPSNETVQKMADDLSYMALLWEVAEKQEVFHASSKDTLWSAVDTNQLEDDAKNMLKAVKNLHKNVRWSDAFKQTDKICKDFLSTVPLVSALRHPSMRVRHWGYLMKATSKTFTPPEEDRSLKLGGLLALQLHEFSADVEEICDQAIKEEKMENTLTKLNDTWSAISWIMEPYAKTDVPMVKVKEEDFELLENDQLVVQGMKGSRFLFQFEAEVLGWEKSLGTVSEVVISLTEIQRTWSYLEPLFIGSEEVKRELPEDAARFVGIDSDVKSVLYAAWDTKIVKTACNYPGLFQRLEGIQSQLDLCKKSLADFLDGRRRQFARYYFTSEADLLDILSNGSVPERIIVHVPKIYLATKTLTLTDSSDLTPTGRPYATHFVAGVGKEIVRFEPKVALDGKVEIYMQTVLDAMKVALYNNLERSLVRYHEMARSEWVMHNTGGQPSDCAQIVLLVVAINYVAEVEQAFADISRGNKNALREFNEKQKRELSDLIFLTTTKLTDGERMRIMCCITMDAHGRDIVERMVRLHVDEVTSFQWQSQLKHRYQIPSPNGSFLNRDKHLRSKTGERAEVTIADANIPYDYDYLGNGPRLVITPLTDRIYVTATQALNLKMGCAPAGPAGTGKTETTKDLANALAKACYVFNCSPEMDYQSLGNIFKGLASSGSWGCFDEFNRLVPEVLSVCSVQFKAVCDGVKADATRFIIEGDDIFLDPTVGAFITMNPGYLGRSELPEGLKALFRPITVMVPDLVLICENMLMAEGFVNAKVLASKFYGLYSLLRELLSKQLHYDWGLRAVKSVLVVAGSFKRAEPDTKEHALLMRALRDFNTPKIVREDEVIFFGLLADLFPNLSPPRKVDEELEHYVAQACEELGNFPDEVFRLKVVQLEELLAIRHSVFVMGPSACGKTQSWVTLAKARTLRGNSTKFVDMNPKSVSTEELYGYITMATREWKDGLLSKIMRDLGLIPNEKPKWIILDGDLDANWIESMNSVMDDNKMLTLASNERIPLKFYMRMIFEIRDLKFASPATVSRAGILYISTDDGTQWRSLVRSWVARLQEPPEVKTAMQGFFDSYVANTLLYCKINLVPLVALEDLPLVQSLLYMLDGVLKKMAQRDVVSLETIFVYCSVWAFGSGLTVSDDGTDFRKIFSDWWRAENSKIKFPQRENVFDYYLDPETVKFEQWAKSPYFYTVDYESTTPMAQVTVPTPETCSVVYWMELLVAAARPVMLAGPAGTGKTQMVMGMLGKQDPQEVMFATINFNFYTSSIVLQNTMELPLEKKTGTNYGPPGKLRLVYFIDDINLPEVDKYATQSAISLLRQQMEYLHVYDRTKLTTKNIMNTQVVSCINPTAGSFYIDPRLQRHFAVFAIGLPGPTSLLTIYQTFLDGHLKTFHADIKSLSSNVIKSALGLHAAVASTFRKTAANFHYEFNIRHLSNVFQGLLVAGADQFKTPEKFVQLWLHESERVYGDRLVSFEDLTKYNQLAQAQSKKLFPNFNMAKFYAAENAEPLIFCHFADNISDKCYDQVTSIDHLQRTLDDALREYNESNATMDLVLFEDAMKHVCRIVRIVLNVAGHALLVGVGGSGKQSLSRLSAYICSYTVKQIVISSMYGINDLKEDLKWMYTRAGVKGEGVMFLMTDSQITNERFLIFINDLLASGNIPDLFAAEDQDSIVNDVTNKVKATGVTPDRKNCWEFFINEVRKNLHVVLCFSPVGDDFRTRARKFPALVNCTVIDWFQPWPKDALLSVGKKVLLEYDLGSPAVHSGVENFMPFSFSSVNDASKKFFRQERRYVYTTPKSYLELLKLYTLLLNRKRRESDNSITRLSNGLEKLEETSKAVGILEENLKVSLVAAEEKKIISEGIAETVAREKAIVEIETAKAEVEAAQVAQIASEVTIKQRDTEADLAKAEPAVIAAMEALNTLSKPDLTMCKTMSKPPVGVDDVFAATMILLAGVHAGVQVRGGKVKDRSWDAAKKQLLTDVQGYLDALKSFKAVVDAGDVPAINWKEVRPYLALPHFTKEAIDTKNSAAGGLCSWVINIVMYYDIVVTVEPKRLALREANQQLADANERLRIVTEKVNELQAKLDLLTIQLNAANKDKQDALDSVDRGMKKLDLAQRLTTALASENIRWAANVVILNNDRTLLVGDVLLAASFISYVGPFTKPFRERLLNEQWIPFMKKGFGGESIPMTENPNPINILTNDAEIASWNTQGLPPDQVSTENGTIVCNTARWALMIDPQLQGIKWIKEKESGADRNLKIVRLGQNDLLSKLERALENGWTILVENMGERIDAVLNPVVQRATIKKGNRFYVKLGDTEVEFSPKFRLILHTKLSNPHFPPEIQAETTLVNFTVTQLGLEDQLLNEVVQKERPELALQNEQLISEQNGFKIKIKELEDNILFKLATAEGDITEDVELIEGLEETKRIANDIAVKVELAKVTQVNIRIASERYRPVAARSSLLFFLMNDLNKVHTYYIYSLSAFRSVFIRGIDKVSENKAPPPIAVSVTATEPEADARSRASQSGSKIADAESEASRHVPDDEASKVDDKDVEPVVVELTPEEMAKRVGILLKSITSTVFDYIRRGLFERDKLIVATQLTLLILLKDEILSPEEVDYLVAGKQSLDPGNMGPLGEWMVETLWPRVKALEGLKIFNGLGDQMQSDSDAWQVWFDSEKPEVLAPPGQYNTLSSFNRLVLLRALRPDRMTAALRSYITDVMGSAYVLQQPFDMAAAYAETSSSTPVFFVLFPGVDPTPWVESMGRKMGISSEAGNFVNISMGQGQEKGAEAVVSKFAKTGGWVMLQNCHLMQSWVPRLERLLEVVQDNAHANFRCYISAEPPPIPSWTNMPESLMQSCVKVANEAPADIKSNLIRSWANFSTDMMERCLKPTEFKACLFSLCWFHSIVLGRRRFGAQGWSRAYSFNTGDLTICANVLTAYLDANPTVPYDDLRYIFGEIMYGGHITDAWDRRTCNVYLQVLFAPGLFTNMELGPGFASPNPADMEFDGYKDYVLNVLPVESPPLFGLHPNAEIGYLTATADYMFKTIQFMSGGDGGGGGGEGGGSSNVVSQTMKQLSDQLPPSFELIGLKIRCTPLMTSEHGPFVVVVLQECTRMNVLLEEIRRSLVELGKGLKGQLNMSQAMEDLAKAFTLNEVPGRNIFSLCMWEKLAWFSKKSLVSWFQDLVARVAQLQSWISDLVTPFSLWLPGLFNPTAYLTAVMQVTARKNVLPLDEMTTETHITLMTQPSQATAYPVDGMFVHGIFIEGARWPVPDEVNEPAEVGTTMCGGNLMDSRLKELLPMLPLVYLKAVVVQRSWEASGVGYLRHDPTVYECPVYVTTFRGPTYIFLATLKSIDPLSKWVLAGVALVLQEDD